jgi:hypothetical protein
MLTPTDIAEHGQHHVEAYLSSTGYHCNTQKSHHGGIDIEARGEEENLLVHVMTAIFPHEVPALSELDKGRIISKAMMLGYDSWLAKVLIDQDGELAGEIQWEQLNH